MKSLKSTSSSTGEKPAPLAKGETRKIREWARQNGYEAPTRGRLHRDIIEAYRSAIAEEWPGLLWVAVLSAQVRKGSSRFAKDHELCSFSEMTGPALCWYLMKTTWSGP